MAAIDIEIVTHCWAVQLPFYADLLRLQAASLVHCPTDWGVRLTVYCAADDGLVRAACHEIAGWFARAGEQARRVLLVERRELAHGDLFRRAIGRNDAALRTDARLVWFTDCDYCFGPGCLENLGGMSDLEPVGCAFPTQTLISPRHADGTALLERERGRPLPDFRSGMWRPKHQHVAIGGIQIVGGLHARRYGYLRGTRWMRPVDPARGFRSCRCDAHYRHHPTTGRIRRLTLPGVYRVRHEQDGRDYDLEGVRRGREVW